MGSVWVEFPLGAIPKQRTAAIEPGATLPYRYKPPEHLVWDDNSADIGNCGNTIQEPAIPPVSLGAMADHMGYENNAGPTVQERTADAVDQALQQMKASNKRKRETSDQGGDPKHPSSRRTSSNNLNGNGHDAGDMSRGLYSDASSSSQDFSALSQHLVRHVNNANHGLPDNSNASSTAAAALAGIIPQLTVPQPTELSFVSTGSGTDGDQQLDSSFSLGVPDNGQNPNVQGSPYNLSGFQGGTSAQLQAAREASNGGGPKPPVGSDEWHKVRRDNHKEGKPRLTAWRPRS